MQHWSRRSVLAAGASAFAFLSGCQSAGDGSTPATTDSATTAGSPTTTSTAFDASTFAATARVVHQPTDDHPPTVELALENTGDREVSVRPADHNGYPMEGVLAWPSDYPFFVWIPPESEHVSLSEHPESRRDGCWRLPEGAEPAVADIRQHRTIDPGESFAVTHHVFFHGSPDGCFSPGEYAVDALFAVAETGEDGPEFGVTFRLTVVNDGTFSMSADGPAGES